MEWINIKDRLPSHRQEVVVAYRPRRLKQMFLCTAHYDEFIPHWYSSDKSLAEYGWPVKYWMPIPPLPEDKEE